VARALIKYTWVLHLLLAALCAALVGHGAAQVLAAVLPAPRQELSPSFSPRSSASRTQPRVRDVRAVVQRNVFCSTCEPLARDQEVVGAPTTPGGPIPTPLALALVATMVGGDPASAHALVREKSSGRFRILRPGDGLDGGRVVASIHTRRVLLRRGQRQEYLALDRLQTARAVAARRRPRQNPARPRGRPRSAAASLLPGVRRAGPGRWEIRPSVIRKLTQNPGLLRGSARVSVQLRHGRQIGFRIHRMPNGGIYQGLGLRNEDVIRSVNGRPLTSPDRALEAYAKLRKATRIVLGITRGGRALRHEYVVR